jgi:predicted dehydrogenase
MTKTTTRREFLTTSSGLAIAGALVPGSMAYAGGGSAGADKLNLGIIGVGGRGGSNMNQVAGENIQALCDVNGAALANAKKRFGDARVFTDWRELIEEPGLDGVVISTADHHHALAAVAAMRRGLHVYSEKPLSHTVAEARLMQDEYIKRRDKIATQMGTQIHASENYRRVVELIRAGAIGPVEEAHVWCSRSINAVGTPELEAQPEPEDFDWDVWLGPAAERPYNQGYWKGGNLNWNRRWEFGNGVLGDMGSHLIDLAFWALDLRRPLTVESRGPDPDPVACPPWQDIVWEHAPRSGNVNLEVPTRVFWYHGPEGMKRRSERLQAKLGTDTDLGGWGIGVAFVGEKGLLVADYGKHLLSPSASFADYEAPERSIPKSRGHHAEWLHACKTGEPTTCNFDYSGALIEHNLLGNVAHRVGKKLEWDAAKMKAKGASGASKFLTKTYRKGWDPF